MPSDGCGDRSEHEWNGPIGRGEMQALLAAQLQQLDSETRPVWDRFGVGELEQVRCVRAVSAGAIAEPESLFVVARAGGQIVVFDDVEDEFGIGVVESDGVLRQWALCGERLGWSLRMVEEAQGRG